MKLKRTSTAIQILASLALMFFLNGCVGSVGVDPSEDPVQPDANENANAENSEENTEDNGENGNFTANEENVGNGENVAENIGNNTGDGEELNNASDDDFANEGNNQKVAEGNNELFGNQGNKGGNLSQNNNLGLNQGQDALVNNAESDIEPAPNLQQGATDGGEELAPVSRNSTTVSTNGKVRYVMAGGTKLYEKPQGTIVKSLEQGDHPLVSEDGEWARTSDGFYVPSSSLTSDPVGRFKTRQDWQ